MTIITGDVFYSLTGIDAVSVQCCVTSPPYWGLRDYGVEGQIGLEPTPEEYVQRIVAVFAELRRVLRDDGTLWLNMGDCYATGAGAVGDHPGGGEQGERWKGNRGTHNATNSGKHAPSLAAMGPRTQPNRMPISGLKPKDLVGIPWRVAFALQADGWYLRSDIIWAKPNPMPESVTDRPTKAHEYLFLLTKSPRYYYDADAIREAQTSNDKRAGRNSGCLVDRSPNPRKGMRSSDPERFGLTRGHGPPNESCTNANGKNKRTVWTIATQPYPEAHFATFPTTLVEPCILAGSRAGDTVLDPFAGAGTVGLVASRLARNFIGIELNPEYSAMAERRIYDDAPLFASGILGPGTAEERAE